MSRSDQDKTPSKRASISSVIAVIVILVGVGFLAYPHVMGLLYGSHRESDVRSYDEAVEGLEPEKAKEQLAAAQKYNERIAARHGASLTSLDPADEGGQEGASNDGSSDTPETGKASDAGGDSVDDELHAAYGGLLNPSGNGVMGSITIDRLNLTVPLYHDDTEENMLYGAAHLEGTSLPIGGPSTHAAAWAHRGEPGASYFKDLDQVVEGDRFSVTAYGKTLTYEVDKISVVEPGDRTQLDVVEGEDLFTLITCTPYGVNSHRLLVRGHRVD